MESGSQSNFVLSNDFEARWYDENGTLHREWWRDGERHRGGGGPAVETADGMKEWWKDGKRHRDHDLPAIEWKDGTRAWWVDGKRHRDRGRPAFVYGSADKGPTYWYEHDRDRTLEMLDAIDRQRKFRKRILYSTPQLSPRAHRLLVALALAAPLVLLVPLGQYVVRFSYYYGREK